MSLDYKEMKDLILKLKINFDELNKTLSKNKKMIKNLQLKCELEEEKFIEKEKKFINEKKVKLFKNQQKK